MESIYADDIVLLTKEPNEMKEILRRLAGFLKKRNLILSVEKSKMIFTKGGGRRKKEQRL